MAASSITTVRSASLFLTGLLLCLGGGTPRAADRVDNLVQREMDRQRIPGLALAVVKDRAIVKAAGYGVTDRARASAVTPDTVFRIGSISKSLLATAALALVEDGRLALGHPIAKYVNVPDAWRPITIEHLIAHTSGLVRDPPGIDWALPQGSDADVIKSAYAEALRFAPGSRCEYSNLNYMVLAEAACLASCPSTFTFPTQT